MQGKSLLEIPWNKEGCEETQEKILENRGLILRKRKEVVALSFPTSRKRYGHGGCEFAAQGGFGAFAEELAILD
jgi:hypothetical protein